MKRTTGQIVSAAVTGAIIGALGGAAIGDAVPGGSAIVGAIIGGVIGTAVAAVADATRRPGTMQPLVVRTFFTVLVAAVAGTVLEWLIPEWSAVVPGLVIGLVAGLSGFRLPKIILGAALGTAIGLGFEAWAPDVGWAVPAAATVLAYRLAAAVIWRGRDRLRVRAEALPADQVRFVVPYAEATGYVGTDYLKRYAESIGASFSRAPHDIGIVASLEAFAGPTFDPAGVHQLVREFYEHTSRFHLSIVPEWRWWMRLPYRIYRSTIAEPLGQANAPFEIDEVQRGVVSWVDTMDLDADGIPDVRAWVRAYQGSDEPLYIGIYTVVASGDKAYVSVGFPLPTGNFTATLLPSNVRGDGLLLASEGGDDFAGHYLSVIADTGVTTIQLVSFGEEIEVFVDDGRLRAEQRFSLAGIVFLTLHYTIERAVTR